jgi:hypothetical protein
VLAALDKAHARRHPKVWTQVPSGDDMEAHFVDIFSHARVAGNAQQMIADFETMHHELIQLHGAYFFDSVCFVLPKVDSLHCICFQ